ncbi:MAG: DUF7010 family protein [Planctomycetota bacterium]
MHNFPFIIGAHWFYYRVLYSSANYILVAICGSLLGVFAGNSTDNNNLVDIFSMVDNDFSE